MTKVEGFFFVGGKGLERFQTTCNLLLLVYCFCLVSFDFFLTRPALSGLGGRLLFELELIAVEFTHELIYFIKLGQRFDAHYSHTTCVE